MKKKKINPHIKSIVVTFKVNAHEMRILLGKALAITNGNVSELIRRRLGLK